MPEVHGLMLQHGARREALDLRKEANKQARKGALPLAYGTVHLRARPDSRATGRACEARARRE